MNMGASRILQTNITHIDEIMSSGKFFDNLERAGATDAGKNTASHLMGLVSNGGLHSMNINLYALLELVARRGIERVFVHCFTDGRDALPTFGKQYITELIDKMRQTGTGRISTVCRRYYAMNRVGCWVLGAFYTHCMMRSPPAMAKRPLIL